MTQQAKLSPDLIGVVEALYDLERPRSEWFAGVVQSAATVLGRDCGLGAVLYDVSDARVVRVVEIGGVALREANLELGAEVHARPHFRDRIVQTYRHMLCGTLDEQVVEPNLLRELRGDYRRLGLEDQLFINGADVCGMGCALMAFSRDLICLSAGERTMYTRLATHVATAYRLQRRLELGDDSAGGGVSAVLKPNGTVAHAKGDAVERSNQEQLKSALQQREWARSRVRHDLPKAIAAWKPLVQGRWSLVDHYERAGHRYILVRENTPEPASLVTLSEREAQVVALATLGRTNKVIAYELGLAHSTVRVLLARAAKKLNVNSRSALVEQARAASPFGQ